MAHSRDRDHLDTGTQRSSLSQRFVSKILEDFNHASSTFGVALAVLPSTVEFGRTRVFPDGSLAMAPTESNRGLELSFLEDQSAELVKLSDELLGSLIQPDQCVGE